MDLPQELGTESSLASSDKHLSIKTIPTYRKDLKSDCYFLKKFVLFASWKFFKIMSNAFYFILKMLFSFLRYLKFYPDFFKHAWKGLDIKVKFQNL